MLFTTFCGATNLFVDELMGSSKTDDSVDFLAGVGIDFLKTRLYAAQEQEQSGSFSLYHIKTQLTNFFEYEDFFAESENQHTQSAKVFLNYITKNPFVYYRYGFTYAGDHYDDFELIGYAKASFFNQSIEFESDLNNQYRTILNIEFDVIKTGRYDIKPILELKSTQDSIWFTQKLRFSMNLGENE